MKNISYFADFGSANRTSGGQTFARELFAILDKLPVNLTVFCAFHPKIDKEVPIDSPKIHPVKLPFYAPFGAPEVNIPWSFKLLRQLKRMPLQDLYVFDQPSTWFSLFPKVPAVVMFHGTDYIDLKFSDLAHPRSFAHAFLWGKPVLNRVQKGFLTRELGTPLFNSHYTLDLLVRDFGVDPKPLEKYITYLPVKIADYERDMPSRKSLRNRFGVKEDEILVIYLSNFAPKKRADRIPPIVLSILKKLPDAEIKFMFVGRGIASGPIDALMQNEETKKYCIRVGEVAPDEVRDFYSAADIALSTSEAETFGYFLAEGMAASLPFVAYPGGAIQELIKNGENVFLVNSENEFVEALEKLIKDKGLREKLGKNGYIGVKNNFSEGAFKDKFIKILTEDLHITF